MSQQLFSLLHAEQTRLGLVEFILVAVGFNLIEAISKRCAVKCFDSKSHNEGKSVRRYQSAISVLGPGEADAVRDGEQQRVGRKGPKRSRLGPKREQQVDHARALGGKPECT